LSFKTCDDFSEIIEKLAYLNSIREEILLEMYEEIRKIISNHIHSDNTIVRNLILEAYLKALKKGV